jgi:hypothetical protein
MFCCYLFDVPLRSSPFYNELLWSTSTMFKREKFHCVYIVLLMLTQNCSDKFVFFFVLRKTCLDAINFCMSFDVRTIAENTSLWLLRMIELWGNWWSILSSPRNYHSSVDNFSVLAHWYLLYILKYTFFLKNFLF